MENQLEEKIITISAIEVKNGRYKITDQDNSSYSFFEKKQDGNNSVAFSQFQEKQLKINDQIKVLFSTSTAGKFTYKNIRSFKDITEQEAEATPPFVAPQEIQKKSVERDLEMNFRIESGMLFNKSVEYTLSKGQTLESVSDNMVLLKKELDTGRFKLNLYEQEKLQETYEPTAPIITNAERVENPLMD